jgi:hypothetical protein
LARFSLPSSFIRGSTQSFKAGQPYYNFNFITTDEKQKKNYLSFKNIKDETDFQKDSTRAYNGTEVRNTLQAEVCG